MEVLNIMGNRSTQRKSHEDQRDSLKSHEIIKSIQNHLHEWKSSKTKWWKSVGKSFKSVTIMKIRENHRTSLTPIEIFEIFGNPSNEKGEN